MLKCEAYKCDWKWICFEYVNGNEIFFIFLFFYVKIKWFYFFRDWFGHKIYVPDMLFGIGRMCRRGYKLFHDQICRGLVEILELVCCIECAESIYYFMTCSIAVENIHSSHGIKWITKSCVCLFTFFTLLLSLVKDQDAISIIGCALRDF